MSLRMKKNMQPINENNTHRKEQRCERKKPYSNYRSALSIAGSMNREHRKTESATRIRPYKCEYCKQYHVGKWYLNGN